MKVQFDISMVQLMKWLEYKIQFDVPMPRDGAHCAFCWDGLKTRSVVHLNDYVICLKCAEDYSAEPKEASP